MPNEVSDGLQGVHEPDKAGVWATLGGGWERSKVTQERRKEGDGRGDGDMVKGEGKNEG